MLRAPLTPVISALALSLLAACDTAPVSREGFGAGDVQSVELPVLSHALPAELTGASSLHVGVLDGDQTLVGAEAGLYRLTKTGLEKIDGDAVVGIAYLASQKRLIIARRDRLEVFDGQRIGKLGVTLDGSPLTSLATRGEAELWIGTEKTLWRLEGSALARFPEVGGVARLSVFSGATQLVLRDKSRALHALKRSAGDTWLARPIAAMLGTASGKADGSSALVDVTVQAGAMLFARAGAALLARSGDGSGWRSFTVDRENPRRQARALVLDQQSGALWVVTDVDIYRLAADSASAAAAAGGGAGALAYSALRVMRPNAMSRVSAAAVDNSGGLWLVDASKLYRVGETGPPPTYSGDVARFFASNCTRCHTHTAKGNTPLASYETVKAGIDAAISAIDSGAMPADKKPLVDGNVNLLRRWRIGGFKP